MISADVDGNDIWVGTAKGLGWGIGEGYYPGTKERRALRLRPAGAGAEAVAGRGRAAGAANAPRRQAPAKGGR